MNKASTSSLPKDVQVNRAKLAERLGYTFRKQALFDEALTHSSSMVGHGPQVNNQRLEFLGDRVIGLIIADILFASTSHEREGHLTRRYADCVENARLAKISRDLGVGAALHVQANTNLADTDKVLADALEALIGAIWRDGGIDAASEVIRNIWGPLITEESTDEKDFKTQLQEYAHQQHIEPPSYAITDRQGPDHALVFTITVTCGGRAVAGTGTSRRQAEQNAAALWIKDIVT